MNKKNVLKELKTIYKKNKQVLAPSDLCTELTDVYDYPKEVFIVFYLDTQNQIIAREIISIGILNETLIHPREVFKSAILHNADSIIVAHNHPSGNITPSDADMITTRKLREAGKIIGIKLLDHIIIAKDRETDDIIYNNIGDEI